MPDPLMTFRCDPDLRARVEVAAKAEGLSLSEAIRDAVEAWASYIEEEAARPIRQHWHRAAAWRADPCGGR